MRPAPVIVACRRATDPLAMPEAARRVSDIRLRTHRIHIGLAP